MISQPVPVFPITAFISSLTSLIAVESFVRLVRHISSGTKLPNDFGPVSDGPQ
ncbi:hypothetical protein FTUN_7055 [Frigoriglobus tundricola]|uniref:Uncharacterized protein n=1 Tax=Frigoriglobus tundricola TaxID=2774151 RepID=A0A6M5Z1R4_9BACT|nr:hypothetical protein FTUN_7055 [Frigoriglobus tundricola]